MEAQCHLPAERNNKSVDDAVVRDMIGFLGLFLFEKASSNGVVGSG